jgi:hypothetical protein
MVISILSRKSGFLDMLLLQIHLQESAYPFPASSLLRYREDAPEMTEENPVISGASSRHLIVQEAGKLPSYACGKQFLNNDIN